MGRRRAENRFNEQQATKKGGNGKRGGKQRIKITLQREDGKKKERESERQKGGKRELNTSGERTEYKKQNSSEGV